MSVMNTIDLTGVSADGWGAAADESLKEASKTIRNIRRMVVLGTRGVIEDGSISEYHTDVRIFFEVER